MMTAGTKFFRSFVLAAGLCAAFAASAGAQDLLAGIKENVRQAITERAAGDSAEESMQERHYG